MHPQTHPIPQIESRISTVSRTSIRAPTGTVCSRSSIWKVSVPAAAAWLAWRRSEEHTSELQSRFDLVCRLLLEKKYCYVLHCSCWFCLRCVCCVRLEVRSTFLC